MRKSSVILVALLLVTAVMSMVKVTPPLKLLHTTPLPGFTGDMDHFAVDLKGHRLFLTAEVHKTMWMAC